MLVPRVRVAVWRWRVPLAATTLSTFVLAAALIVSGWYLARDERLGRLDFPTSCSWRGQTEFTRATALLHLFQFVDAEDGYRDVIRIDPDCAIAYWGVAISRLQNPLYALPNAADAKVAHQALEKAASAREASARERAYIDALTRLFGVSFGRDWPALERDYAAAMGRLVADYPQDAEAKIFYALALNLVATTDGGAPGRAKAAELLLQVFAEHPEHPGIEHYLTYCLGHLRYQPKPFEREGPTMTSMQRLSLVAFGLAALCGLGAFVTFTADLRPGLNAASGIGGPFALVASDGKPVTDRSFRGRWMLLYFGYTHCPDICPTTLLGLSQALTKLGPLAAKVQPVFVSIDPERDTQAAVGEFTKALDPRIVGLTGKPAEIAAVAKQYRVFYKKVPGSGHDDYLIEHSSYIYVIGPDGRYVTLLAGGPTAAPDETAARLRELLAPSPPDPEPKLSGAAARGIATFSANR